MHEILKHSDHTHPIQDERSAFDPRREPYVR